MGAAELLQFLPLSFQRVVQLHAILDREKLINARALTEYPLGPQVLRSGAHNTAEKQE